MWQSDHSGGQSIFSLENKEHEIPRSEQERIIPKYHKEFTRTDWTINKNINISLLLIILLKLK
jgi:hypothetical protein